MHVPSQCCMTLVGLLGAGAAGVAAEPLTFNARKLGKFPLCEASAAISPEGDRVLVGDNTVPDKLFSFEIENGELEPGSVDYLSLGHDVRISDIEALTMLKNGEVMVFGSHSRNSQCRPKKNRRRFLRGHLTGGGFEASTHRLVTMKQGISCRSLFGYVLPAGQRLAGVCTRLDEVEQAADDIWDAEWSDERKTKKCRKAQPFNVEGAVTVTKKGGPEEVWVGLRSPVLPVTSEDGDTNMAILMRLRGRDSFKFDAVALVDLGGDGIRGLAFSEGWVFGIAGPSNYREGAFKLWKFPSEELEPEAEITPKVVVSLCAKTSPEGLVVFGSKAHVFFDGDRGACTCESPAGYWAFPLSR